jgi:SAM-dependent methyltransferase
MRTFNPTEQTTVLDVGVSSSSKAEHAENFLEEWYPHQQNLAALGMGALDDFQKRYPKVKAVQGSGLALPFADKSFDIVFSNAVIEHVGSKEAQQQFIRECLRVGRRVFITTPSRSFPVELHTMVPFVHWLPMSWRNRIYRALGRKTEASESYLRLLWAREFCTLFPPGMPMKIFRQRFLGFTVSLIAVG